MIKAWIVLVLLCQVAIARELTVEQKLSDLNEVVSHVKSGYGPIHFKKQRLGIDVDDLKSKYIPLIQETKTNAEFYYLIIKFVAEFNDSHFRANLPTNLSTYLGFSTDLVQGKVVIDEVNRTILPLEKFPFEKGDEVVSMNGRPVREILDELIPYMGQGYKLTAERKATAQISNRRASKVPAQKGSVKVEVRRGDSAVTETVVLEWKQKGQFTDEFKSVKFSPDHSRTNYDMIKLSEESFRCSPESRIKRPEGAIDIMKASCAEGRECKPPFVAYYYPTTKGNVGYLRIPHYSPEESNPTIDAMKLRFSQYEYAVKVLEKNTVGLIIDQDHNCGGSVEWLHKFMSLFMEKPFAPMQFELLASKASYVDFMSWTKDYNEHTIPYQDLQKVGNLIKDTWLNTNSFFTPKTAIDGEDFIYPNPVHYTKPIIILIDEMSGSGGDAFPAMMQGNDRALLLGTRTMGAGGHVVNLPPLANSQIQVAMTKSLFYRPDDVPVENNGAHPDIPYTHTMNDFKYGYQEYRAFYTNELLNRLK